MPDRQIRFHETFFDDLDSQLPAERSADGLPSATDLLLFELPQLRDLLARDFFGNTTSIDGAEPLRVMIQGGNLVKSIALYATEGDGVVTVLGLDIELHELEA